MREVEQNGVLPGPARPTSAVPPPPGATLLDDQDERWGRGERVLVEDYLRQHPDLLDDEETVLDLIYNEFRLREEQGETPRPDEYLSRFRQWAPGIQLQFEVHQALTTALAHPGGPPAAAGADWPTIPGYELLEEIGRGGMGVVYKARQTALNRLVALKMIRAGASAGLQELARFAVEANAVARLQHPHIVQIFDVGEQDGQPYLVMEYVDGGSLEKHLAKAPQPAPEAARLVETLARAICHIHEQGIIHRDLKPANILLSPLPSGGEGSGVRGLGTPKITDFGLAKALDGEQGQTQSMAVVGTPSYMAPEQAMGKSKLVNARSDVYALGAILYEALTGRPPFRGTTPPETLEQVRSQEPVPPRQLQPKVPRNLETICLKCLRKEPQHRYDSAAALAEDLENWRLGRPIRARPVGLVERLVRWCRRNPGPAAAIGTVLATVIIGFVLLARFAHEEGRQKEKAQQLAKDEREQKQEARRRLARLAAARADDWFELKADPLSGLLWLARGLATATEAEDTDLQQSFRALLGGWCTDFHPLHTVLAHPQAVRAIVLSPDGTRAVTATQDGTVRQWEVPTGKEPHPPLPGYPDSGDWTAPLAFSLDGKSFLTRSWNPETRQGEVWRWDTASGQSCGKPLPHPGEVKAAAFSPDGKLILTGSWNPRTGEGAARLWDAATGEELCRFADHPGGIWVVAFSADGQTLLTCNWDRTAYKGRVQLWERDGVTVRTRGKEEFTFEGGGGYHCAVALAPDGKLVAAAVAGSKVQLWDAASGTTRMLEGHRGAVRAVAFSPDGRMVVSGSEDRTTRLWQTATGEAIGEPMRHQGVVRAVTVGSDNQTIFTGSADGTARLWKVAAGWSAQVLGQGSEQVGAVVFSSDRMAVLTRTPNSARLWDATTGKLLPHQPPPSRSKLSAATFGPGGMTVLSFGGEAQLWDGTTNQIVWSRPLPHPAPVKMIVRLGSDGRTIRTAGSIEKTAHACLWDAATGELLATQALECTNPIKVVDLSPDGRAVVTGTVDQPTKQVTVQLWDAATGQALWPIPVSFPGLDPTVAFSPDGKALLIGGGITREGAARLHDAVTGQPIWEQPRRHPGAVRAAAFGSGGQSILTGGMAGVRGEARSWDVATGRPRGEPMPHPGVVLAVAFSPNGRVALTGAKDGTVRFWDAATGYPLGKVLAYHLHPSPRSISGVAFSPDGRLAASWDTGVYARLWHVPTPLEGEVEQIKLWIEVITGMELAGNGAACELDRPSWRERWARLRELGGPPLP